MLLNLTHAAQISAALAALLLARRRADHRPFAAFLVSQTLANLVRAALVSIAPIRPLDAPPFTGLARVAFHIDQALFLTWFAGLAAAVLVLFAPPSERREETSPMSTPAHMRPWTIAARSRSRVLLVAIAWAGVVAYLSTHYPAIRGEALRGVYLLAELATLTVAGSAIITWTWRRDSPTPARVCTLFVCLVEGVAVMGGGLRWGLWDHWYLDQIAALLMYVTLTVYQVSTWRSLSSSQSA